MVDTSTEVLDSGGAGAGRTLVLLVAGAAAFGALWLPTLRGTPPAPASEPAPVMPSELFEITLPPAPVPARGCFTTADAAARLLADPSRLSCVEDYRRSLTASLRPARRGAPPTASRGRRGPRRSRPSPDSPSGHGRPTSSTSSSASASGS